MPRQIILRVVDTRNQHQVAEKIQEKPIVHFQEPEEESEDEDDDLLEGLLVFLFSCFEC